MYTEGLCLLAFTLPLLIIFAFNMVYMTARFLPPTAYIYAFSHDFRFYLSSDGGHDLYRYLVPGTQGGTVGSGGGVAL